MDGKFILAIDRREQIAKIEAELRAEHPGLHILAIVGDDTHGAKGEDAANVCDRIRGRGRKN